MSAKGQCPHCNSDNPYGEITCQICGRLLPWANAVEGAIPSDGSKPIKTAPPGTTLLGTLPLGLAPKDLHLLADQKGVEDQTKSRRGMPAWFIVLAVAVGMVVLGSIFLGLWNGPIR